MVALKTVISKYKKQAMKKTTAHIIGYAIHSASTAACYSTVIERSVSCEGSGVRRFIVA